jgi:hypothetical protein
MRLRGRDLLVLLVALPFLAQHGLADAPPGRSELPPDLDQELAGIQDFTYDFDQPAYYHLLEFVQNRPHAPGFAAGPLAVNDWRALLERPADYRGMPVTVEGIVGRNKDPYVHARHPELRPVSQVELSRPDQALTCTIIFTQDVADIPIGSTIRATGYFVKINRFPRQAGEPGLSALIVASGPSQVTRAAAQAVRQGPDWRWMMLVVGGALVLTIFMLRRARRFRRHDLRELRPDSEPGMNLAADLAAWAEAEPPDRELSFCDRPNAEADRKR